ncbi:MAG: hypothetical protein Q8O86_01870 [Dehalococcoidia bacterium]|nr:hypothetical protein [Dehalococcoidia bacterium]
MKGKLIEGGGLLSVGLLGLLPELGLGLKMEDFNALVGFVLWILIGLVVVKVLAILAGVS